MPEMPERIVQVDPVAKAKRYLSDVLDGKIQPSDLITGTPGSFVMFTELGKQEFGVRRGFAFDGERVPNPFAPKSLRNALGTTRMICIEPVYDAANNATKRGLQILFCNPRYRSY